MKQPVILCAMVVLVSVLFAGCPEGVGNARNTLTIHNNDPEDSIRYLSVVRLTETEKKVGINLLENDLAPGESFTVSGLVDGTYEIYTSEADFSGPHGSTVLQTLEGGNDYDYYVRNVV